MARPGERDRVGVHLGPPELSIGGSLWGRRRCVKETQTHDDAHPVLLAAPVNASRKWEHSLAENWSTLSRRTLELPEICVVDSLAPAGRRSRGTWRARVMGRPR